MIFGRVGKCIYEHWLQILVTDVNLKGIKIKAQKGEANQSLESTLISFQHQNCQYRKNHLPYWAFWDLAGRSFGGG